MITRPIPFSPPMVRATIDGKKSQTRRIVKPQPIAGTDALRDIPGENRWWAAYAGKDPTGVTYRPLGSDLQHDWRCHRCTCGNEWEHANTCAGDEKAHTCSECGSQVWSRVWE